MRIIQVQLNYTTEQEYYKLLGILLLTQKLLNDYIAKKNSEEGIGPEGFAEEWIRDFGVAGTAKDQVLETFSCALLSIARNG